MDVFTSKRPSEQECRQAFIARGIIAQRGSDFYNYYAAINWTSRNGFPIDPERMFSIWIERTQAHEYLSNQKVETPREPFVANQQALLPQVDSPAGSAPQTRQKLFYNRIVQILRYRDFFAPQRVHRAMQYHKLMLAKYPSFARKVTAV